MERDVYFVNKNVGGMKEWMISVLVSRSEVRHVEFMFVDYLAKSGFRSGWMLTSSRYHVQ